MATDQTRSTPPSAPDDGVPATTDRLDQGLTQGSPQPGGEETQPSPADSSLVDAVCDRFQAAWREGKSPNVEDG